MTHTVAATSHAPTTPETGTARAARPTGTSFAAVHTAAVKASEAKDKTTPTDDAKGTSTDAPKGERTQKVSGHKYVEIVSGPRNGMFINNTGGKRDGEAFLIVKRHGHEFHIYGTGTDRTVYEVGRERGTTPAAGTTGTTGATGTGTTGTTGTGTTGTGTTGTSATGTSAPATGSTGAGTTASGATANT